MKKIPSLLFALALATSVPFLIQKASATDNIWNNGTTDWGLTTNWSLGALPTTSDVAVFSSVSGAQTINMNGDRSVSGLSFNHSGSTTIASGNATTRTLTIGGGGITVSAGGSVSPTIGVTGQGVNVAIGANQTWQVAGVNSLVIATGTMATNGFTTTINGTSSVSIVAGVAGNGGFVKNGASVFSLYSANTFSGGIVLNAGSLRANANTAFGTGTLTIAGGSIGTVNLTAVTASNAVSVTNNFSYSSGPSLQALTLTGAMNLNGATRTITQNEAVVGGHFINGVVSNGGLVKAGTGTLTLGGVNTYTGSTTVSAGTLILADNSQTAFTIGSNGVNNQINGTGLLTLDGDFSFNLAGAGTTLGDTWTIVDVGTLSETFGATFTVVGFNDIGGNLWELTNVNGGRTYRFNESTGILSVTAVPEPATWALLATGLAATMILRRRKVG